MTLLHTTAGTKHMSANHFVDMVGAAQPGDGIIYASGSIAASCAKDTRGELLTLREVVQRYQSEKRGCLTQRRRGADLFDYIFTVRA